jgi:DNA-binding transcriptional LysR family regulator
LATSSVSAAAEQLGLTQAATSNALKRLRTVWKDPLLVRVGNAMQLTPRAVALKEQLDGTVQSISNLMAARVFEPKSLTGHFVVATSDHVDSVVLERVETAMAKEAPDVGLLVEAFGMQSFERMDAGLVDLVVAPIQRVPERFMSLGLFDDTLVLAGAGPQVRQGLSCEQFAALEFLVVAPVTGTRGSVDEALEAKGLSRKVVRSTPQFLRAVEILKRRRHLVTLLPQSFARSRRCQGLKLASVPSQLQLPPVRLRASWSNRSTHEPRHQWFRGLVHEATVDFRPGPPAPSKALEASRLA